MKRIQLGFTLVAATVLCFRSPAEAEEWPQWRGPARDGISRETGLLKQWPQGGPRLLWQVKDLGYGFGSPAIVGDRIYLTGNRGLDEEVVEARDATDGRRLWSTRIGKVGNPDQMPNYPGARSTPTVDGELLYVLGSDGDLACLETSTGKVRWQKSVRAEFGGKPGAWAYAESPLVDGDSLVVTPGGGEATLVALNKRTGDLLWKAAVPGGDEAGYASIIVVESGGIRQYVQFVGKGLVGVDSQTGRFLWRFDDSAKGSPANMSTPVASNGLVYSATGRAGGAAIRLKAKENGVEVEPVYQSLKLPNVIGGAVKAGDFLYGVSNQVLQCVEFRTGAVRWEERVLGPASLLYADGNLYLHGENGEVALVEATPEGFRERGRFTPPDQPERGRTRAWAYPALANGRLYIRDLNALWCYDVTAR